MAVCFCQFRSVNRSLFDTSALIRSRPRRRQHKEAPASLKFTTVLPFDPNFNIKTTFMPCVSAATPQTLPWGSLQGWNLKSMSRL